MLDGQESVSNRDVVAALGGGITRQAVHLHLADLVASGVLEQVGDGRGARYRRRYEWVRRYLVDGLDESNVWNDLRAEIPAIAELTGDEQFLMNYLVTEM